MQETNIQQQLADTNHEFRTVFSSIPDEQVNTVPYEGSWTPAQVAQHVLKSEVGMMRALQAPAKEADRDAYAGVPRLKAIFLDFSSKLKSPEMAVPETKEYNKAELLQHLDGIAAKLTEAIPHINNNELITGLPAGDLTKGEIIHFLLYHTKRHIHQLQKMAPSFSGNKSDSATNQANIIQLVNEAFIKNDMPLFLSYCTDDIEWNMVGDKMLKGKETILQAMESKPEELPDSMIDKIITDGNTSAGTGRFSTINKEGLKQTYRFCDIYTFREGRIASMESYVVAVK